MLKNAALLIGAIFVLVGSGVASSQTFNLNDTNTSITLHADDPIGIDTWDIYGLDNAFTNTYLWRVGDSGTADYVQNLTLTSFNQFTPGTLSLTYENAAMGFAVDLFYALVGGTENFDLSEVARVRNIGSSGLNFRLFQYSDFDLRGSAGNDTVTRVNSSSMLQSESNLAVHYVAEGVAPVPDYSQIGVAFVNALTTNAGVNLDTAAGNGIGATASGNVAYGLQWNKFLAPGQNFTISTNKIATAPEPASIAGFLVALVAMGRMKRKKPSQT